MVFFAIQELLLLIRFHLFIFVYIFITLGGGSKKIFLQFMSKSVLPMFSSRSFMVYSPTFRSSTHFEFIFVNGVRAVQFPQHHLLERLSFLHCLFLLLLLLIN